MLIAALVFAALAALVHVYIFILESVRWTAESTRKTFGIPSLEVAQTTKSMAYNQGFYNLFLAIVTVIGIVFVLVSTSPVGPALMLVGTGSMLAAAAVLFLSTPSKRSAAIRQGGIPLLAVIATIIALAV